LVTVIGYEAPEYKVVDDPVKSLSVQVPVLVQFSVFSMMDMLFQPVQPLVNEGVQITAALTDPDPVIDEISIRMLKHLIKVDFKFMVFGLRVSIQQN